MHYLQNVYVGNGWFVNFADAAPQPVQNEAVLYPLACYLQDTSMRQWAASFARQNGFFQDQAVHYHRLLDNYPAIGRDLQLLLLYHSFTQEQNIETTAFTSWFPQLQVFLARSCPNSMRSLIVAGKAGNNGEQHNHNDVGSFILYADGQPLFIDLGRANYDASYFNDRYRYQNIATRSAYHNVPYVNGIEQAPGKQYAAREVSFHSDSTQAVFSADLAPCYPPQAHVQRWQRTVTLHRQYAVTVCEDYQLTQLADTTCLTFVSLVCPQQQKPGTLSFQTDNGQRTLGYPPQQLKPLVDTLTLTDPYLTTYWGNTVYRIRLLFTKPTLKGSVSYQLR